MNESNIFGISVRALIAYTLVIDVCIMALLKITVTEPVYTLVVMAVSFYMGKSTQQGGNSNGNDIPKDRPILQQPVQEPTIPKV